MFSKILPASWKSFIYGAAVAYVSSQYGPQAGEWAKKVLEYIGG